VVDTDDPRVVVIELDDGARLELEQPRGEVTLSAGRLAFDVKLTLR
jgi:putative heme iron utilization protein